MLCEDTAKRPSYRLRRVRPWDHKRMGWDCPYAQKLPVTSVSPAILVCPGHRKLYTWKSGKKKREADLR